MTPRPEGKSAPEGFAPAAHRATAAEVEAFYRELFLPLVPRAVRRHRLSNEDARDIVQEAFVVALAKMGTEGNAFAWLKQVVDFMAVNFKRTAFRRAELLARWMPGPDQSRGARPGAPVEEI